MIAPTEAAGSLVFRVSTGAYPLISRLPASVMESAAL
jgi:hypothetical protein